ncbi:MAG: nicotinate phosphoribosyltransferase, partial [Chloroflexota bacterium]
MNDDAGPPSFPLLPQVLQGDTADIYFVRAKDILEELHEDPWVGMEIFPARACRVCGITQIRQLLQETGFRGELWSLSEADSADSGEAAVEIFGHYSQFGIFETAMLGILASCTGWCTAAAEAVDAAAGVPVVSFGARHVHANVAAIMDFAAVMGGCVTCSTPLGAALAGTAPSGTMAHAYILILGDTVRAATAFDRIIDPEVPRVVLVDTFQDEAVESVRAAE